MENLKKTRCGWAGDTQIYRDYHDHQWGIPEHSDATLFEMLILESMQAGLSWLTILKKREGYRQAFDGFDPCKIAVYDSDRVEVLMQNPAIIRNRLKIQAAINNAKLFLNIQEEHGSFDAFIWRYVGYTPIVNHWQDLQAVPATTPLSDQISCDLKKLGFKFVGSTIIYAYMQAIGMVNDHLTTCFCHPAANSTTESAAHEKIALKNGKSLCLAPADPADAAAIIDYLNLVGGESDNLTFGGGEFFLPLQAEEEFLRSLAKATASVMLVGRIDGQLACVGSLMSPTKPRLAHQGELALSVKKAFWGMGVGTALLTSLIQFAKKNGQTEILHLGVKADNHAAIALYQKMGFDEIGRYKNFFKIDGRYWDEILMNRYLSSPPPQRNRGQSLDT